MQVQVIFSGWPQGRGSFRPDLIPAAADQHLPRPAGAWKQTSRPPSLLPAQAEPMSIAHGRLLVWLAGLLACWLGWGPGTQHTGTQHTAHSKKTRFHRPCWAIKLGAGWQTEWQTGRPAPRFPTEGSTGAQGHTCEARHTGAMYLSLPITLGPRHGLPCMVFSFPGPSCKSGVRVTMSSPPESNFLQHRAQGTEHSMHACNTTSTRSLA